MRFTNHIALRFLTDDSLTLEIIKEMYPNEFKETISRVSVDEAINPKVASLWQLVSKDNQKAYVVTDTVFDKLELLKVKKDQNGHYDWTVFNKINACKKTFILPPTKQYGGGGCLRLLVENGMLEFCHICYKFKEGSKEQGTALWTMFFIDSKDNRHAEHCVHQDVQDIYEFIYKLLCFIFLSENEYEVIDAGQSKGTRKNGKIKNDLPIPIIIINSKWNVTSIRSEGFIVSGHFALRHVGVGRSDTRMVYIEPYSKNGYIRHAKNKQLS